MNRPFVTLPPPPVNECWSCHCRDDCACTDKDTGEPCSWVNADKSFCSVCALLYADLVIATGEMLRAKPEFQYLEARIAA